jgi:hypothetical protein
MPFGTRRHYGETVLMKNSGSLQIAKLWLTLQYGYVNQFATAVTEHYPENIL